MRLSLAVRDVSDPRNEHTTQYTRRIDGFEECLPEGFAVTEVLHARDISMYVRRSYLKIGELTFVSELQPVVIDPPDNWGPMKGYAVWHSATDPELCAEYHSLLLAAGWEVYGQ